jgi:hypothetical protein
MCGLLREEMSVWIQAHKETKETPARTSACRKSTARQTKGMQTRVGRLGINRSVQPLATVSETPACNLSSAHAMQKLWGRFTSRNPRERREEVKDE